jgi:hypothetical protein
MGGWLRVVKSCKCKLDGPRVKPLALAGWVKKVQGDATAQLGFRIFG